MKSFIRILVSLLFVLSCQEITLRDKSQMKSFDIRKFPDFSSVNLSDLGFVEIDYIPLETNEHCLIPVINDIKVGNEMLLVHFFTTIYKFQPDGSFVTKIGVEGRGPNEFLNAHHVEIDEKTNNIYLVSGWENKFFVYSEDGKFLRSFQSPPQTTNFRIIGDNILCYCINTTANSVNSYYLIDKEGSILKEFPNKYKWNYTVTRGSAVFVENIFYWYNSQLFKKEVYSDTVYSFEKTDFIPHLAINQGEKLLTVKARSDLEPLILFEKYISQNNLFEFGDYIYYEFGYGLKNGGNNFRYGFIGSKKDGYQEFINVETGLINDLDCGPNIWPKTMLDDNTLITWIDASQLKNHVASSSFKNAVPKYPDKKKALEILANSLGETDNPVLIIIRLKKQEIQ